MSSSMNYIAGAAVERDISERILSEARRSHNNQIQSMIERFQVRLDEMYDANVELKKQLQVKDAIIGQKDGQIRRLESDLQEKEKKAFNTDIEAHRRYAETIFMQNEVKNLIHCNLPQIIEEAFKKSDIEYRDDIADHIKSQAALALGFSSDIAIRERFIIEYGREVFKLKMSKKPYWGPRQLIDKAVEIANQITDEVRQEKIKMSGGVGTAAAYADREDVAPIPMAERISFPDNK